jgi:hypothetical protein
MSFNSSISNNAVVIAENTSSNATSLATSNEDFTLVSKKKAPKKIKNNNIYSISSNTWSTCSYVKPSTYKKNGMKDAYDNLRQECPDDHVICITYKAGDTQFAVSETFKVFDKTNGKPDPLKTIVRGLKEELLREIDESRFVKLNGGNKIKHKDQSVYYYSLNLNTLQNNYSVVDIESLAPDNKEDDDNSIKSIVIIHGDIENVQNFIPEFSSGETDISAFTAIPMSKLSTVFKFLA